MKIKLKSSIKAKIDAAIKEHGVDEIECIYVTDTEYISLLEEICITSKVLLSNNRTYRDIKLVVH